MDLVISGSVSWLRLRLELRELTGTDTIGQRDCTILFNQPTNSFTCDIISRSAKDASETKIRQNSKSSLLMI